MLGVDLVEGVAVEEFAVFHYVLDGVGVVDVVEGIFVEDDEVGQFAGLDGAEVLREAHGFGAAKGGGAKDVQVGSAAGSERPHFPVKTETLELAVAADADAAAGLDELGVLGGEAGEGEFIVAGPDAAAAGAVVDDVVREETADFGVVVDFGVFVEIILSPGAAVGDDQGGRVENAGAGPELDAVIKERGDGETVFVAAEAVDGVGEVELHVEGAFGGGHDTFFFAGHDHPLALLTIADQVRF